MVGDLFGSGGLSSWHYEELYSRAQTILQVPKKGTVLPTAEIRISQGISGSWFWDACWNTANSGGGCPFHGSEQKDRKVAIQKGVEWIEKKIPHMTKQEADLTRAALETIQ